MITDVIIDAGCCQKCENDVETSDLLAATSSGCATWLQKLNMFSLSELVAASIQLNDFVVDMSDSDASDSSRYILDALVNAAIVSLRQHVK